MGGERPRSSDLWPLEKLHRKEPLISRGRESDIRDKFKNLLHFSLIIFVLIVFTSSLCPSCALNNIWMKILGDLDVDIFLFSNCLLFFEWIFFGGRRPNPLT